MVLIAKKQIEQTVLLNDVDNISILGLDQGCILLFSAITTSLIRNSTIPRTVIGGVQLSDGEQKIYHRHPSCVKITHASINATRSLCCFVTRTESLNFDVFVAEIGVSSSGRLFSLRFSRPSPIRAYLAPHDVILLLYRDAVTVFRMPSSGTTMNNAVALDKDAQLNECIYYQWDTLQQRLHIIQKRPPVLIKTTIENGYQPFVYTSYTINSRGQFDSIMKVDFDLKIPPSAIGTSSTSDFEIISNDTSLYLCWQLIMKEETERAEYAVISLGHGRSLYITKALDKGNWEIFQSRKVHFGLLDGDYVFAILRGEFVHLLNFNVQLNFLNHLFFPNDPISLPYDTKYTTQRGLINRTLTLLYEKRNLCTYTIEICPNQLIKSMSTPITIQSVIAYVLVATKDNDILQKILEKILFDMYDDLNTKTYLMSILTALVFIRLSKKYHNNKYVLVFPGTTVETRHTTDTPDVKVIPFNQNHKYHPEHSGTTNLDQEYYDKLRISFFYTRKYHRKLPYYHQIMSSTEESELIADPTVNRRPPTLGLSPPPSSPRDQRSQSPGFFTFGRRRNEQSTSTDSNRNDNQRAALLLNPRNEYLFQNISSELHTRHPEWGTERIREIAYEYVETTGQCNYLIKLFTRLAGFDRTQPLIDDDHRSSSEKYKSLLIVMEKLYLAMIELGFSPTDDLQRILTEISFRVLPFDRFISAIDQNILTLTREFVQQVISELDDDDPKSYSMKEQLILMLPNNSDLHSSLFDLIGNNRAKRMSAQLLVARSLTTDRKIRSPTAFDAGDASDEIQVDEIANNPNGINTHSRLVEQAAVTFYRDCFHKRILDRDELRTVKAGLLTLASSAP